MRIKAFAFQIDGCREDSACLHLRNLRISVAQTAATVTEHWVVFAKAFNACTDVFNRYTHCLSHLFLSLQIVGYKFVERRIEQTNVYGIAVHSAEDTLEVFLLVGEEFCKCFLTSFYVFSQNHFAHGDNLLVIEEHVLSTAETDTYSAE